MQNTVRQYLGALMPTQLRELLRSIIEPNCDRNSSQVLSTAGLVVTATAGHYVAKIGSTDCQLVANGQLVTIAAGTDMPALVGTITAAKFNVFCFFCDYAGTVTVKMGVEAAAMVNVKFPEFPEKKALVGFIIVTYASTFTGGSTALDTATTIYVSPTGSFEPSLVLG